MNDEEIRRKTNALTQGFVTCASTFTLGASPATSTVVAKRGVSSNSVVLPMAVLSGTILSDITAIVPTKDSFTVYHSNRTATRVFAYAFFTNAS